MEGKSGASSRGNSSSNSVYSVAAVEKLVVEFWAGSGGPLLRWRVLLSFMTPPFLLGNHVGALALGPRALGEPGRLP